MSTDSYIFIFLKRKFKKVYISYQLSLLICFWPHSFYLFFKYRMGPHALLIRRELEPDLCLHQAVEMSKACDVSWQLILSKGFSRVWFLVSHFVLWGTNQSTMMVEGIIKCSLSSVWDLLTSYFLLHSRIRTLAQRSHWVYNLDTQHG